MGVLYERKNLGIVTNSEIEILMTRDGLVTTFSSLHNFIYSFNEQNRRFDLMRTS